MTLHLNPKDQNAELGYRVGAPHWGRGYATEAAGEMLRYDFEELGLHRVHASHLGNNPARPRHWSVTHICTYLGGSLGRVTIRIRMLAGPANLGDFRVPLARSRRWRLRARKARHAEPGFTR